jgi:hypothetical protein
MASIRCTKKSNGGHIGETHREFIKHEGQLVDESATVRGGRYHRSRVRRASGFLLTAFSNATPHTLFNLEHYPGVASEKALA